MSATLSIRHHKPWDLSLRWWENRLILTNWLRIWWDHFIMHHGVPLLNRNQNLAFTRSSSYPCRLPWLRSGIAHSSSRMQTEQNIAYCSSRPNGRKGRCAAFSITTLRGHTNRFARIACMACPPFRCAIVTCYVAIKMIHIDANETRDLDMHSICILVFAIEL